ncbi:MAG: DUF692 domain-containing protein [Rhodobacteraceae bacterium]|nr:DUF692 domain-containing protein [Paracoccaceae bacterium]
MTYTTQSQIPALAGVGYKPQHLKDIQADSGSVKWLEIHAENYMMDGGPPIAQLRHLRDQFPISCHGVGLSIGGELPLDVNHLARLKKLVDWLQPGLFSEHLAWSTHDNGFLNDLLPLPYNAASVTRVANHVDQLQNAIGRQMLLENPSAYVAFTATTMDEIDFLTEIVKRTGCGLLLDVNNVFVSGTNQEYSPEEYIERFPVEHIGELHLGGHAVDSDDHGAPLLIDSHDHPVVDPVWELYDRVLARTGPLPTLVEWDNDIPDWAVLESEARHATAALGRAT